MTTSEYGGRVRVSASILNTEEPLGTRGTKVLASNAHHFADMKCNHLVNWVAARTALLETPGYRSPDAPTTDFARLCAWGPLPLTIRPDRSAYPLRLELAGATSNVIGGAVFGAVLVPDLALGTEFVEDTTFTTGRGAIFKSTSSTTAAWLDTDFGAKYFGLSRSVSDPGWGARHTLVDTGGHPTTVDTCEAWLVVYAKTSNIAALPRLYGVHLSEHVGA